jgi:hypothetical protein
MFAPDASLLYAATPKEVIKTVHQKIALNPMLNTGFTDFGSSSSCC